MTQWVPIDKDRVLSTWYMTYYNSLEEIQVNENIREQTAELNCLIFQIKLRIVVGVNKKLVTQSLNCALTCSGSIDLYGDTSLFPKEKR